MRFKQGNSKCLTTTSINKLPTCTGEDVATIKRLGFSPLGPLQMEERTEPLVVDWDLLAATR